jgi:agmatine deiminase
MTPSKGSPAAAGWRMPAEWQRHRATWLAWPHEASDWPGKLPTITWVIADIIRWLAMGERVGLLVRNAAEKRRAANTLKRTGARLSKIDFPQIPTNRSWLRDSGPIFVKKSGAGGPTAAVDFGFNAWAKYPNWRKDSRVPRAIARWRRVPVIEPIYLGRRVILEGGALDVDGRGTALVTEECLLGDVQQRNPGFTRQDYERVLCDFLGVRRVVWLGRGIAGDDTHGHVDDIARFVAPDVVLACVERDRRDVNHAPLADNLRRLRAAKLEIVTLPMPRPVVFDGQRLPASYANFYIGNDVVLVPTFNDPLDRLALEIIARCFRRRQVVGIHSLDLVWGLGTIHCQSQQEPA